MESGFKSEGWRVSPNYRWLRVDFLAKKEVAIHAHIAVAYSCELAGGPYGHMVDRWARVMIRVVVADDQALLRGSFQALIDAQPDLCVVGEAGNGLEAVELAEREQPDLVLMDVRMPEMDGIEATRRVCAAQSSVRVLILTMFDLDAYVYSALRAGASGFLLKDAPPADLLAAVRTVAAGEALLAPTVTRRLIDEFARRPEPRRATHELNKLTERELEVLALIAKGLSNAEIAERLHVSHGTVKTHVSHLLAKFEARDRAQLVIVAYETGLVSAALTLRGQ